MPRPTDPGLVFYCTESGGALTWVSDSDGSTADVKVIAGCDPNAHPPTRFAMYSRKYEGTTTFGQSDGQVLPEAIPSGFDCTDYEGTLKPWAISAYPNRAF
jgi:hypothetical protein